jgi:hypothetical protein
MSDIYDKFLRFRGKKPAAPIPTAPKALAVPTVTAPAIPKESALISNNKFNPDEVIYLTCSSTSSSYEEPEPEPEPEPAAEADSSSESSSESSSSESSAGDLLTREIKRLKKQDEIFLRKFGY